MSEVKSDLSQLIERISAATGREAFPRDAALVAFELTRAWPRPVDMHAATKAALAATREVFADALADNAHLLVNPPSQPPQKRYSRDNEEFIFDTATEAMEDMAGDGDLIEGASYYEITVEQVQAKDFDHCVESLLDQLDDELFEEVGESADNDFTSVDPEAKDELAALVREWITKHNIVSNYWHTVGESREITVTAEDVLEHGA